MECWYLCSNPESHKYESGVRTNTLRSSDFTVTKRMHPYRTKLLPSLDGFHIVVKGKSAQQLLRREGVIPLLLTTKRAAVVATRWVQAQVAFGTFRH
jgi:hypothetical protein